MPSKQTTLDVGDTRKPAAVKDEHRVTTGDLAALSMCAHRYDPSDVAGYFTHEFEDVVCYWITSNVSSVICRLSEHCEYSRGKLHELHLADDLYVEAGGGPTQTKLVTDGGTDQRDPTDDPAACSKCGVHIGAFGGEYCDPCAREIGAKPPMERCMNCGQLAPQEQMEDIDVSPDDEYYPDMRYLCWDCAGGNDDGE